MNKDKLLRVEFTIAARCKYAVIVYNRHLAYKEIVCYVPYDLSSKLRQSLLCGYQKSEYENKWNA